MTHCPKIMLWEPTSVSEIWRVAARLDLSDSIPLVQYAVA